MKTCQYAGEPFEEQRSHPWTNSAGDAACRYYDLVREPELIRTALEDFRRLSHYPAVQSLYELLEWLNAPTSSLETNDCAFSPPEASDVPQLAKALQCEGRLMILFRDLELNLSLPRVEALRTRLHLCLEALDTDFELGVVGTTVCPVLYIDLPGSRERQLGHQLMISFWAWGDSEAEVMDNLERLVGNLRQALLKSVGQLPSSPIATG
jgi:hypothetical protein